MKSVAVIFAGGAGIRMNAGSCPKQFLELHGKPIIIYTLELFEAHPDVAGIIIACIESWIPFLKKQIKKFEINKVLEIVSGGDTGQKSIYNGLMAAKRHFSDDTCVMIHDGVRPLITQQTITDNIRKVYEKGNCITCVPTTETFMVCKENGIMDIPSRKDSLIARAPQSFILSDICAAHERAKAEGITDFIDSCTMMSHYDYKLHTIIGPIENIKITTPTDFYIFRALLELHENQQIFGF